MYLAPCVTQGKDSVNVNLYSYSLDSVHLQRACPCGKAALNEWRAFLFLFLFFFFFLFLVKLSTHLPLELVRQLKTKKGYTFQVANFLFQCV